MIRLDTVNRSLQMFLGAATTSNPLQVIVCYSDQTLSTYQGSTQLSNSNGTTAVTICSAPASGATRDIDMLSVLNTDTVAANVTIEVVDTSTPYQLIYVQLSAQDKLTYTHGSGWQIVTSQGNIKYSVQSVPGVTSFNSRTGVVTLTSSDVTTALTYTPAPQTSGTSLLYGNGSGGFSNVTIGSGVTFSGGTLSATGSGTVSSVGLSLPSIFTVSGSPVTTSGTLTATLASETANTVFAAPNGSSGTPTFRSLVNADLANSSLTIGSTSISLGGTTTSLSGLSALTWAGSVSGTATLQASPVAGSAISILPNVAGILINTGGTGVVSNTMLANSTISGISLGSNLANLTAGTNVTFSSGSTYNGSTAITINASSTMVYPGAGIPNSTGSAWGTSYSTTGSGTVVALATSPTLVTPILGTPQSGNFSTGTFTWPTFNQNTTGTAANITATSNSTLTTLSALSLPGSQVTGNISGNATNVTGTVAVGNGGTGATTLTGYVYGNGTGAMTASTTIPNTAITGLGTMSTQNATSVAITGGTIDNTVIGGTTPSAGTFTTITGQTANLIGSPSNLITYSQLIGGTSWVNSGTATSTQNTAVAPDSTTTASTITSATDVSFNGNNVYKNAISIISSTTYTFSCYIKFGTSTTVSVAIRDNSSGSYATTATTTASGWTRVSATITTSSTTSTINLYLGSANGTFYAWGAQLNTGSSATAYTVTTSSAVYGYPSLSFNGNMGIEMDQSGNLILQPAGTGALQAQQTTSTATGGNARGANAVDWQTSRGSAGNVASASYSVIMGGTSNSSSATQAVVGGGGYNSNSGNYSFLGGGSSNTISSTNGGNTYSVLVGGISNTASGVFNFIGGGYTNSGTATSAVTTQSATMNGTTAVTLSGSNASIKVGQIISGTYISNFTYVSAISGTSLTLSQVASGSGTATLSFYTPHGVVVGGGNNQATGSYSFVGGGGDAGTSGNRNTASGDWSSILGGKSAITRGVTGAQAYASGEFSAQGDAQTGIYTLRNTSTSATLVVLTADSGTAGTLNQAVIPSNYAYTFRALITGRNTSTNDTASYQILGSIQNTSGTVALVGTPTVITIGYTSSASTWAVSATADNTNKAISINATGVASTTIHWVCKLETVEVG